MRRFLIRLTVNVFCFLDTPGCRTSQLAKDSDGVQTCASDKIVPEVDNSCRTVGLPQLDILADPSKCHA